MSEMDGNFTSFGSDEPPVLGMPSAARELPSGSTSTQLPRISAPMPPLWAIAQDGDSLNVSDSTTASLSQPHVSAGNLAYGNAFTSHELLSMWRDQDEGFSPWNTGEGWLFAVM